MSIKRLSNPQIFVSPSEPSSPKVNDVWVDSDEEFESGGGVTDHGALTGLGDDDHTQYHNDTRGDTRYYTKSQVDTSLSGKANSTHTHAQSDITNLSTSLAGKANTGHTHPTTDLTATGGTSTSFLRKDNTWATPTDTNTTYTEITEAEITPGTATTERSVSGRRAKYIQDTTPQRFYAQTSAPSDLTALWYDTDDTSSTVLTNSDTVDGYHASATRTASTIPVLGSDSYMPANSVSATSIDFSTLFNTQVQVQSSSGSVTIASTGAVASTTVSFSKTFSGAPVVFVQSNSANATAIRTVFSATSISSTGFTLNAMNTVGTGSVGYSWVAIYTTSN